MRFLHALHMMAANFKQAYKLLVYKLVVFGVIASICYAILYTQFGNILRDSGFYAVINKGWLMLKNVFVDVQGAGTLSVEFKEAIRTLSEYIKTSTHTLGWVIAIIVIFSYVYGYFSGIADYAMGDVINDHMSSFTHRGFLMSLFKYDGKRYLSQLFITLYRVIMHALMIVLMWLIMDKAFNTLGLFSIFLCVCLLIIIKAAIRAFLTDLRPSIITDGKSVTKALKGVFTNKFSNYLKAFLLYIVIEFICVYLVISVSIITFGAGLLIIVPAMSLFFVALQFVNYYMMEKKRFYITYDNIVIPKELREEEKLLNKMDI